MKGTVTLRNPIKVDGNTLKELTYDFEKITIDDFMDASARSRDKDSRFVEDDKGMQLYLAFYAVNKENPGIAIEDLGRLNGFDLIQLANLGGLFTRGWEGQAEEPSEETSEPTAGASRSARMKSAKEA